MPYIALVYCPCRFERRLLKVSETFVLYMDLTSQTTVKVCQSSRRQTGTYFGKVPISAKSPKGLLPASQMTLPPVNHNYRPTLGVYFGQKKGVLASSVSFATGLNKGLRAYPDSCILFSISPRRQVRKALHFPKEQ